MLKYSKFADKLAESIVKLVFSKERKVERYVLILTLVGFFFRLLAALREGFFADDAIYASQSAGIISAKIISTHSHPALFSYLTDFAYYVFGYTTFAARFFPLIAGTLLIPLIFLIVRKMFNERVGLIAAFLATITNFLVRMTFTEHTLVTTFFVFFAIYLGMIYLDNGEVPWLIASAVMFGLGCLTKYNSPFFVFAFLCYAVYYKWNSKETILTKKNLKHLIIFGAIIFIFSLPFLTFNYLLYKEKGLVDFQFNRILKPEKAQEMYKSLGGQDKNFLQSIVHWPNYHNYKLIYTSDLLLFVLGISGLFFMYRDKMKNYLVFFVLLLLIPFFLQSAGNSLQKHFAFMHLLFIIPASYSLVKTIDVVNNRNIKIAILTVITVLLIINLGKTYAVPSGYYFESGTSKLKSFINTNVGENDLIVFDPRIYTSITFWMATDHSLLNSQDFLAFYQYQANLTIPRDKVKVYFVECGIDDCGWGWVRNNQPFNKSAEDFFKMVSNMTNKQYPINSYYTSGNELISKKDKIEEYKVYELEMPLNTDMVRSIKGANGFYFVPYLYINMQEYIYSYTPRGIWKGINSLSLLIIYISMAIALISFVAILILLIIRDFEKI